MELNLTSLPDSDLSLSVSGLGETFKETACTVMLSCRTSKNFGGGWCHLLPVRLPPYRSGQWYATKPFLSDAVVLNKTPAFQERPLLPYELHPLQNTLEQPLSYQTPCIISGTGVGLCSCWSRQRSVPLMMLSSHMMTGLSRPFCQ